MYAFVKNLFFKNSDVRTFAITRLSGLEIDEKVYLQKGKHNIDITQKQGIICLDPFCIAVWLLKEEATTVDLQQAKLCFYKGAKITASINVSIIEKVDAGNCILLLYKIMAVKNYQTTLLHRFVLFAYLLRNKASTYRDRRVISALYSYPRKIIIVSYQDENYCNIFPMDIQGYIQETDMYILGLRTTNVTLNKILEAKKVVVCDTDKVDINTVYTLGKHPSASPTPLKEMPFTTSESEVFKFPIPDFTGSYKEIEIIMSKKMGFHMLMLGRVVNTKVIRQDVASLYHVGFLEHTLTSYNNINGQY